MIAAQTERFQQQEMEWRELPVLALPCGAHFPALQQLFILVYSLSLLYLASKSHPLLVGAPGVSWLLLQIIPHLELLLWSNSFSLFLEGPAALLKPSPECCCVPGCG